MHILGRVLRLTVEITDYVKRWIAKRLHLISNINFFRIAVGDRVPSPRALSRAAYLELTNL